MSIENYKIGFVGWNPFQFNHVKPILNKFQFIDYIIEKREKLFSFAKDNALFKQCKNKIIELSSKDIAKLDGVYDVLIFQTPMKYIHLFKKTKVVFIQYGYAKDPHNFGAWRALADLNLVYGQYAAQNMSYFTPIYEIGHPRNEDFKSEAFIKNAKMRFEIYVDKSKKTILYAPTWGDLSTLNDCFEKICALKDSYNVIIKAHHNSTIFKEKALKQYKNEQSLIFLCEYDDLFEALSVSDVVISDYSGAIFDAIFCHKKLILINKIEALKSQKQDNYSLEIAKRHLLGNNINIEDDFSTTIEHVLASNIDYDDLLKQLYNDNENLEAAFTNAIEKLMREQLPKSQMQQYIASEMKILYAFRAFPRWVLKLVSMLQKT